MKFYNSFGGNATLPSFNLMDEDKNGYLSPTEFVDFTLANIWQNITIPPNENLTSALLYSVARQDTAEVFFESFTEAMKSTDFITDGKKHNIFVNI